MKDKLRLVGGSFAIGPKPKDLLNCVGLLVGWSGFVNNSEYEAVRLTAEDAVKQKGRW